MRVPRCGPWRTGLVAAALLVAFSVLVNLAGVDARSDATEELEVLGPAPITVTTDAAHQDPSTNTASTGAPEVDDEAADRSPVSDAVVTSDIDPPALGRTVLLDLARQPAPLGADSVFAYTPFDPDATTTAPLAALDGASLWHQPADGMSAVTTIPGAVLGYAYPHDGQWLRPLAVSGGGTTVVSNLAAGGATWEWTDRTGTQFLNHYDLGRELQASFFIRTPDGRKLNPTEAGDRFADWRVAAELRHSSPLMSATVDDARQITLSVPLEWSPPRVDTRAGTTHPVIYPDLRLGKEVDLAYDGRPDVARYDTIVTLPAATHHGELEAPTAYLRNSFNHLFTFDARTGVLAPITPVRSDKKGSDWTPPSGVGGLIASDAIGTHAFAIYAATTAAGGTISKFTAHDFHVDGPASGPDDVGTVKLRALRSGAFVAGTTRTTTYIVTGTFDSVQRTMLQLAHDGMM